MSNSGIEWSFLAARASAKLSFSLCSKATHYSLHLYIKTAAAAAGLTAGGGLNYLLIMGQEGELLVMGQEGVLREGTTSPRSCDSIRYFPIRIPRKGSLTVPGRRLT